MRAVNTISLNGNAWQIEAEGCEALAAEGVPFHIL